ncbi:MAG: site-2 protease family protein, partial [Pseudomonadota bacterium]
AFGVELGTSDIAEAIEFAQKNELSRAEGMQAWHQLHGRKTTGRQSFIKRWAQRYMFMRIPLIQPEPMLARLLPWCEIFYQRAFWTVLTAFFLVGAFLASRQAADLESAFYDAIAFQGLILYAVVLFGLKIFHELGHALTCARYGCRVPTMGIAIMIGAPILYTDTTDSWRLAQRRQRLFIVFGGVAAELIIACLALWAWLFLDDGPARDVAFALFTGALVLTAVVNLNPFMRFDGYYGLSDALNVPNLQSRSFALSRWRLRQWLFDLRQVPPEQFHPQLQRFLIYFGFLTWGYR